MPDTITRARSVRVTATEMYLASWEYGTTRVPWAYLPDDRKRVWYRLAEQRLERQGGYTEEG